MITAFKGGRTFPMGDGDFFLPSCNHSKKKIKKFKVIRLSQSEEEQAP